ncbi:ABC transporter ATP-binding protein [Streptomyces albus]|uniref:ABC transporter ATP-binding protein n=1 Tax=Streptomyces albus TaxID=1888 RepID=UPI003F4CC16D
MSWAVRLENVGRRYRAGGPWVVRGVDLEIGAGTLVRVAGGNGGGKSTLLRLIAGIDAPSAGRVRGRPPARGYVPERFPASLPLTALDYLTHLGRIRGLRTREAARQGARWLERFGADGYADTRMRELSKGSSQKVAVAQALLGPPGLLVLDEAWTGLDRPARAVLDDVVRERTAAGGAVVFVDHDPSRLADSCTTVLRVTPPDSTAPAGSAGSAVPSGPAVASGAAVPSGSAGSATSAGASMSPGAATSAEASMSAGSAAPAGSADPAGLTVPVASAGPAVPPAPDAPAGAAAPAGAPASAGPVGGGVRQGGLTRIEALGAPGARVPAGLPQDVRWRLTPGGDLFLTVPHARSDEVLRVLLDAGPPESGWHIRAVREEGETR